MQCTAADRIDFVLSTPIDRQAGGFGPARASVRMAAQQGASQEQPRRRSRFAVPAEAAADGNGDPLDLGAAVRTLATALVTATRTVVNQEEAISLPPEKRRKTTSSSTATTSTTTLDAALALTAASLLEVPLQQPTAAPALQRLPILNWGLWREHVLPCLGPRDLVRLGHVNRHYRLLHAKYVRPGVHDRMNR